MALEPVVSSLSDQNYAESLAFYRFWLDIGQTYHQISLPDLIFDTIWGYRVMDSIVSREGKLIHPTAHLILRLVDDAELDHPPTRPHNSGLRSLLSTRTLGEFFKSNLRIASDHHNKSPIVFCADANLIAHWANLGYVEEAAIRHHILQSLISHPQLHDHQADALIILFKLAGATFETYTDPSVIDRCFELLKGHSYTPAYHVNEPRYDRRYGSVYVPSAHPDSDNKTHLQVGEKGIGRGARAPGGERKVTIGLRQLFQELVALRERGWEGLPPPPVFASGKPKPTGTNRKDPAATPVATFLGLPNRDLEPQNSQPPPPESVPASETDTILESPVTAVIHSPSISIATLSDFTVADASDDGSPVGSAFAYTSDDEPLIDHTAVVPHETFYLEDGNVEVLCGNTLFRVHTTVLSFHSPALRQMFTQTNLVAAESPNGCPRILSSDAATDFVTVLNVVSPRVCYPSPFQQIVSLTISVYRFPERDKVPDFTTF